MNENIDPTTGMPIDPNRAGAPSRSINNLQAINTIQDPGMQSAQQAAAFQKFNNVAQYMPPPTMMKVTTTGTKGKIKSDGTKGTKTISAEEAKAIRDSGAANYPSTTTTGPRIRFDRER